VHIEVADVRDVLEAAIPGSYDGILLDVDNGPDFLVHEHNAPVYGIDVLRQAGAALGAGGLLAIWSSTHSASLYSTLAAAFGAAEEIAADIVREGRPMTYYLYVAGDPTKA
jgi:hypothetical protein